MTRGRRQLREKPGAVVRQREDGVEQPEHPVLALQRSAGNSAVTQRLLARHTKRAQKNGGSAVAARVLAREPEETAAKDAPKRAAGVVVTFEGVGTLNANSYSLRGSQEVTVTADTGELSTKLMNMAAAGTTISKVVITFATVTITLTDVVIASYQVGGGGGGSTTDTIVLNFVKMEFKYLEPDAISGA